MRGTVLVPLDGSDIAERALPAALGIAMREALPLRLIHVHDSPARPDFAAMAEAEAYLGSVLDRIGDVSLPALTADVLQGEATAVLLHEARRRENAILVMSTRGTRDAAGEFASERASQVMGEAAMPVLAFGPAAGLRTDPRDRAIRASAPATLLAPLDGTRAAQSILPHALRLIRASGGRVVVLSVLRPDDAPSKKRAPASDSTSAAARYLEHIAITLSRAGATVNQRIVHAEDVAAAIVRSAAEENAHAIVMTMRTHTAREPFGSTFRAVLLEAHEPVLVCRPDSFTE